MLLTVRGSKFGTCLRYHLYSTNNILVLLIVPNEWLLVVNTPLRSSYNSLVGVFFGFLPHYCLLGIIIPTDFHIFQRGRSTTKQLWYYHLSFPVAAHVCSASNPLEHRWYYLAGWLVGHLNDIFTPRSRERYKGKLSLLYQRLGVMGRDVTGRTGEWLGNKWEMLKWSFQWRISWGLEDFIIWAISWGYQQRIAHSVSISGEPPLIHQPGELWIHNIFPVLTLVICSMWKQANCSCRTG